MLHQKMPYSVWGAMDPALLATPKIVDHLWIDGPIEGDVPEDLPKSPRFAKVSSAGYHF